MNDEFNNNNNYENILKKLHMASATEKNASRCCNIILPLIISVCIILTVGIAIAIRQDMVTTAVSGRSNTIMHHTSNNDPSPVNKNNFEINNDINQAQQYNIYNSNSEDEDIVSAHNSADSGEKLKEQAMTAMKSADYRRAIVLLSNYLSKYPNDVSANYSISTAYKNIGETKLADHHYDLAQKLEQE